jgi:hypothetical protein
MGMKFLEESLIVLIPAKLQRYNQRTKPLDRFSSNFYYKTLYTTRRTGGYLGIHNKEISRKLKKNSNAL